ncbi:MAG TPA: hypothetical protein VK540_21050 [Polyangiaceae bacterium]|nr:hypothetical protein [Polyangiaceae bacterium]
MKTIVTEQASIVCYLSFSLALAMACGDRSAPDDTDASTCGTPSGGACDASGSTGSAGSSGHDAAKEGNGGGATAGGMPDGGATGGKGGTTGGSSGTTGGKAGSAGGTGGSGGQGGIGGIGGRGGNAGSGCPYPNDPHPVSGSGFEAYEGVVAIEVLVPHQICPGGGRDERRIENGRFDLLVSGYGSVTVFLDTNGDGVYQKNEPDWFRNSSAVTPADFDAQKEFHVDIVGIRPSYETEVVNIAFCSNPDAVDGSADGDTCLLQRFGGSSSADVFSADMYVVPQSVSFAVWFTEPNVEPWPFQRRWAHFMASVAKPPCIVDGDLTTCSLSFADFMKGNGVADGGREQ